MIVVILLALLGPLSWVGPVTLVSATPSSVAWYLFLLSTSGPLLGRCKINLALLIQRQEPSHPNAGVFPPIRGPANPSSWFPVGGPADTCTWVDMSFQCATMKKESTAPSNLAKMSSCPVAFHQPPNLFSALIFHGFITEIKKTPYFRQGEDCLPTVCNNEERIYRTFKPGQDVILPCGFPPASESLPCSYISWLYNRDQEDTLFQTRRGLVKQMSTRADRLGMDANCSLVIKQATPEDAGRYTCRLGDSDCYDVTVFLSLPTVFLSRTISDTWTNDEPIVECSLLRYMGASFFQPKLLRWVHQTGALITDGVTASSRDADYFCNMNVTRQSNGKFTCQAVNKENNVEIQDDFTPLVPRARCKTIAKGDIVMLVDGSGSVGLDNFKIICDVITRIVEAFNIGPEKVQIGLTQYSGDAKTEWSLNKYRTKGSLKNALANLQYKKGNTNTGAALTHILENDFKPMAGMRRDSRKIVVLLVDGTSQDDTVNPSWELKRQGIELYAIGVRDASTKELKGIASKDDHVYHVDDFKDLHAIANGLSRNLCKSIRGPVGSSKSLYHFYQSKQDVTLPCSTPMPSGPLPCSEMSWFHSRASSEAFNMVNGGKINPRSLKTGRVSLGADCSLVIKRVTAEDVGRYTCRWNDDDRYKVNVYLSLFTIYQIPTSRYLKESNKDDVALQCKVWKFPDYTPCGPNSFRWFNETGAIITDPLRPSSCESVLIVTRQSGHNQTFTCQFVNGENNVVMKADYTPVFPEMQEDVSQQ
ncbi:uncharacterized protein LOC121521171 [Cheilinus undulatus]|uniref:uncharacterized protein LOC121521171 n=1 Tax=Cheilinus undulatus TaxID=241271 RepID=UPI001BD2CE29|nr:uncharacterized protein LOC121521171 [Cheilinus undulatus]